MWLYPFLFSQHVIGTPEIDMTFADTIKEKIVAAKAMQEKILAAAKSKLTTSADSTKGGEPVPHSARRMKAWQTGIDYHVDDIVKYKGDAYQCVLSHTSLKNEPPPEYSVASARYWRKMTLATK